MQGFSTENLLVPFSIDFEGDKFGLVDNDVPRSFSSSRFTSNCDVLRNFAFPPVEVVVLLSITKGTVHAPSSNPAFSTSRDILFAKRTKRGRKVGIHAHIIPSVNSSTPSTAYVERPPKNISDLHSGLSYCELTRDITAVGVDLIGRRCSYDDNHDNPEHGLEYGMSDQ